MLWPQKERGEIEMRGGAVNQRESVSDSQEPINVARGGGNRVARCKRFGSILFIVWDAGINLYESTSSGNPAAGKRWRGREERFVWEGGGGSWAVIDFLSSLLLRLFFALFEGKGGEFITLARAGCRGYAISALKCRRGHRESLYSRVSFSMWCGQQRDNGKYSLINRTQTVTSDIPFFVGDWIQPWRHGARPPNISGKKHVWLLFHVTKLVGCQKRGGKFVGPSVYSILVWSKGSSCTTQGTHRKIQVPYFFLSHYFLSTLDVTGIGSYCCWDLGRSPRYIESGSVFCGLTLTKRRTFNFID
jgi:hypothetical protein